MYSYLSINILYRLFLKNTLHIFKLGKVTSIRGSNIVNYAIEKIYSRGRVLQAGYQYPKRKISLYDVQHRQTSKNVTTGYCKHYVQKNC